MLIRRGAQGEEVRDVQVALNKWGYGPLAEDGVFGQATESAVKLLQEGNDLIVDGIIGPSTFKVLGQESPRALSGEEVDLRFSESSILGSMRGLGYQIHEDGQVNIVGIRFDSFRPNKFDDTLCLLWKVGDAWEVRTYPATCDPGTYWLESPMRVDGAAILCPGQYVNVYKFDMHYTYETLCQRGGTVKVWRDNNKDEVLDHVAGSEMEGYFGINIHHAGKDSTRVEKWSAGCQVFKRLEDWREAMQICKDSGAEWFTYTLIDDKDLTPSIGETMDIKALLKKYGVTISVAGGCLVIGSQYGSCTIDPMPPAPVAEEAPKAEEAPAEKTEAPAESE